MFRHPSRAQVRTWALVAACFAVLAGTLVLAQTASITQLSSESLKPQTVGPEYVWGSAVYGTSDASVSGNNSSVIGHTLLLNHITSHDPAVARYNISFLSLKDLNGYANSFTLYLPAQVTVVNSASFLTVQFGDRTFKFLEWQAIYVPWYNASKSPVYIPANSSLIPYPGPYRTPGNLPYLSFHLNSSTLAQNDTIALSITAPKGGQVYLSNIVLTASFDAAVRVTPYSETVALLTLPVLGVALVGIYYFLRRFSAGKYVGTLAAAFSLRVALAPFFVHADIATLLRYDLLYYNYGIVNLQSWTYGVAWLGSILVLPAPVILAGVTPTVPEWDTLLKLPAIAADLLTFLVLVRILLPRLGERRAYGIATVGWLFNPLVVYTTAVHGLGESVVAFLVTATAYLLLNRRFWWGAVGAVVGTLTILPAACVEVPAFFSRRLSWWQRAFLIAAPVATYVVVFLALYHSTDGMTTYLVNLLRRTSYGIETLGAASRSPMSYLYLPDSWFGVYLSPALGATLLVAACLVLFLQGRALLPSHALIAVYGSLLAFYLTYEVFYVQQWIWAIPVFVALVAFAPGIRANSAAVFVTLVSGFAVAMNLLSSSHAVITAAMSLVLFAWLLVPLVLWIPRVLVRSLPVGAVRLVVRIAGAGFALSLLVDAVTGHALPISLVEAAFVAAAGFLLLAGLPQGSPSRLRAVVLGIGEVVAIVGSLFVAYKASASLPPGDVVASCGLAMAAMAELALWTVRLLRTTVPSPTEANPASHGVEG